MLNSIQSFLTNVQNNQMLLLLFSGGVLWTVFSNIQSIFGTIWSGILACISFTVNSVYSGEYETPIVHSKMTKLLSDSKVLWERHTELQSATGEISDSHIQNAAFGRSYRWIFGHFMILERTYSTQSTKVVVTLSARIFFANRRRFIARLMKEIEKCSLTGNRETITVSMGKGIFIEKPKRKIDSVYSNDGTPEKILNDVRAFIANRNKYIDGDSPYKFVALLTGKPGTGKTSVIHAVASELGMGIRFINTDDEEFEDIARIMARNDEYSGSTEARSIIVIEDVDCMAMNANSNRNLDGDAKKIVRDARVDDGDSLSLIEAKRELARSEGFMPTTLSLSSILNLLDGIVTPSGSIVFLTSNNPEKLDSALLRDGRIDSRYEFENLNGKTANSLVKDYLGFEIDGIRDEVSPSSLQRDVMKVRIGRLTKEELTRKYSKEKKDEGKIQEN